MKIIVFSDSHGNSRAMTEAVLKESPRIILHLGDYVDDCDPIRAAFPSVILWAVAGNGDRFSRLPPDNIVTAGGLRLFMTHGHLYGVKRSRGAAVAAARRAGADVLLYGHTHVPYAGESGGLLAINPGSVGYGSKTYAVLEIEHGAIRHQIVARGRG